MRQELSVHYRILLPKHQPFKMEDSMKRREFLKSATFSFVGATLPILQIQPAIKNTDSELSDYCLQESKNAALVSIRAYTNPSNEVDTTGSARICLVGIGNAGVKIVNQIAKQVSPEICSLFLPEFMNNIVTEKVLDVGRIGFGDPVSANRIKILFENTDTLFLVASIGDDDTLNLVRSIAELANEEEVLTIGMIDHPETYTADKSTDLLQLFDGSLDNVIDTLVDFSETKQPVSSIKSNTFFVSDPRYKIVNALIDMITNMGMINLDFYDFQAVATSGNRLAFGYGKGTGKEASLDAAKNAISVGWHFVRDLSHTTSMIIHMKAGEDFSLLDCQAGADYLQQNVSVDVDIIFGLFIDKELTNEIEILVITNQYDDATSIKTSDKPNKPA
jgi:cell division GTPase FtsZ